MFQLSLVLYLNQVCLQLLIKVHGSWRSEGLWLCSGHHLGSSWLKDLNVSPKTMKLLEENIGDMFLRHYMRKDFFGQDPKSIRKAKIDK
jgi:hypothetical protein